MSVVLVVEDDPSILRGFRENLRLQSHDVLEAADEAPGHRRRVERKPDLVILDLMLPDMNGFDICRKLRTEGFKVRALQRRFEGRLDRPENVCFDDVEVDFMSFEAHKRGVALELTRKEFGVLRVLAGREGEAVSREELLTEVWGYKNLPTTRTVDTHIGTLRAKLEDYGSAPRRLLTVHGIGYKLRL